MKESTLHPEDFKALSEDGAAEVVCIAMTVPEARDVIDGSLSTEQLTLLDDALDKVQGAVFSSESPIGFVVLKVMQEDAEIEAEEDAET